MAQARLEPVLVPAFPACPRCGQHGLHRDSDPAAGRGAGRCWYCGFRRYAQPGRPRKPGERETRSRLG